MYLTKLTYNEHVVIKRWWSAVVQVLSGSVCVVYCNGGLLLLAHVLSWYFAVFCLFFYDIRGGFFSPLSSVLLILPSLA